MSSSQNQQQSTICFLVEQSCEDNSSYNDYSQQIVMFVKQNQTKEVRPIIETIKKIIKNKKKDSPVKLLALKLLNDCLTQAVNEEFLSYADIKIMSRLGKMARYKKESTDIERGATLFGLNYNQRASADFLKLLLLFIQKWATIRSISGKQTETMKLYSALVKERVQIPNEEAVYSSLSFDNQEESKGLNNSKLAINKNANQRKNTTTQNIELNKNQFLSYQGNPQQRNNSQNNLAAGSVQVNKQSQDDQSIRLKNDVATAFQPQNSEKVEDLSTRGKQVAYQNQIKEDYKKMNEYHKQSKFAEEVFEQSNISGEIMDDMLLGEFRTQLTEGKQFSEDFLKKLMDSPFPIKDQEQKVNKILQIIGEISSTLEKILIFKPYSPRSLRQMEEKLIAQSQQTLKQTSQNQKPPLVQNMISPQKKIQQNSKPQRQQPPKVENLLNDNSKQNQSKSSNKNKARYGIDSENQNQIDNKSNELQHDPFKVPQLEQKNLENTINQDIFRTNFAFPQTSLQNNLDDNNFQSKDQWGTNIAANFNNNAFGDFNSFVPIQSTFDQPISSNRRNIPDQTNSKRQDPQKPIVNQNQQIPLKQQQDSKPQLQKKVDNVEVKVDSQFEKIEVKKEAILEQQKAPEVMVKKVVGKQKVGSGIPPTVGIQQKQIPQHQSPMFLQQVNIQPGFDQTVKEQLKPFTFLEMKPQNKKPNEISKDDDVNSNFESPNKKSFKGNHTQDVQFGLIQKPSNHLLNKPESPDADLSDDDDQPKLNESIAYKDLFKFPSPDNEQRISRQSMASNSANFKIMTNNINPQQVKNDDFSWDFNARKSLNKQKSSQSGQNDFGFNFPIAKQQPSAQQTDNHAQSQLKSSPGNPFNFDFQPKNSAKKDSQKSLKNFDTIDNQKSPFSINQSVSDHYQNQAVNEFDIASSEQKFDFNMDAPSNTSFMNTFDVKEDTKRSDTMIEHINFLKQKIDDAKLQNENLKLDLKNAQIKLREKEKQYVQYEPQIQDLTEKVKELETERLENRVYIEEMESKLKPLKKFEYLYEQEKLQKTELSNDIAEMQHQVEEYKKMAERQQLQASKRDIENERLKKENEDLRRSLDDQKEQFEKDLEDQRLSEKEIKIQLQQELFRSKQAEDDLRVQIQKEQIEFRKREEQIQKKYEEELRLARETMQQNIRIFQIEKQSLLSDQNQLRIEVDQLNKQLNEEKERSKELSQQQKMVIRPSMIKFNKEKSPDVGKRNSMEMNQQEVQTERSPVKGNFQIDQFEEIKVIVEEDEIKQEPVTVSEENNFSPFTKESPFKINMMLEEEKIEQQYIGIKPFQNIDQIGQFKVEMIQDLKIDLDNDINQYDRNISLEESMSPVPSSDSDREERKQKSQKQKIQEPIKIEEDFSFPPIERSPQVLSQDKNLNQEKSVFDFNFSQEPEIKFVEQNDTIQDKNEKNGFDFTLIDRTDTPQKLFQKQESQKDQPQKNEKIQVLEESPDIWDFNNRIQDSVQKGKDSEEKVKFQEKQDLFKIDFKANIQVKEIEKQDYNHFKVLDNKIPIQELKIEQEQVKGNIFFGPSLVSQENKIIEQAQKKDDELKQIGKTNVEKKDSFLEMFGDILGSNKSKDDQQQTKQIIELNPKQNQDFDLNLDDLLGLGTQNQIDTQNKVGSNSLEIKKQSPEINNNLYTPEKLQPIQQQDSHEKKLDFNRMFEVPPLRQQQQENINIPPSNMNHGSTNITQLNNVNHSSQSLQQSQIFPMNRELEKQNFQTHQIHSNSNHLLNNQIPQQNLSQHMHSGPQQNQISPMAQQQQINQPHIIPGQFQTNIQPQNPIVNPLMQKSSPQQQQNNQMGISPNKDISFDKSQFSTVNTESLANEQNKLQLRLDPAQLLRANLQNYFRKSLGSNKAVLYEDQNLQIGMISDYQPNGQVRMRVFVGGKPQGQMVSQIKFVTAQQPIGYQVSQNRDSIPVIQQGQQEPIDITIKIAGFQLSIPLYSLNYSLNNVQMSNLPIRLPIILLKFCSGLDIKDAAGYIFKWNFECSSQDHKQSFNVDFNQCRSLSQLKEVLQLGKNAITFVDGVEAQKNIICGGTSFTLQSPPISVQALIKITITANGQNCEIVGRSNDNDMGLNAVGGAKGKFVQHIMSNILEMIAIHINN
ncbi:UNKNOWN [Stylonychia lemnae]|uniref:VHS domain-containing protein n=1 Tax=Stylonychia lemnae TaxID=5949 RepID=A0A078ACI4_STYLE|nr:UNKNOWN [Stylonychia lemnae]|eukprot:CDW78543.1 UNKNOWN [Stylonychia lemnae]